MYRYADVALRGTSQFALTQWGLPHVCDAFGGAVRVGPPEKFAMNFAQQCGLAVHLLDVY
jgi:hypothetical protein